MYFKGLVKLMLDSTFINFGFTIKEESLNIVKYENESLVVSISFDQNSYEVDITFFSRASNRFFGFVEMQEHFYPDKLHNSSYQITNEMALEKWLCDIKLFLLKNFTTILENVEEFFNVLQTERSIKTSEYEDERNYRMLVQGVDEYWIKRDYLGLVNFIKGFNIELDASIKKKLEFSLKKIINK